MIFVKMSQKIRWVEIIMYMIVAAIVLRLSYSQFFAYEKLSLKATESWQRGFPIEAARGKIYDCRQKILVDNLTTSSLIVVPSQIKDPEMTAEYLSDILQCSKEKLLQKMKKEYLLKEFSLKEDS